MTLSTFKYVLAAVGLVMLLGSLAVCSHTASFVRRAARAQGVVTALVRHQASNSYNSYNTYNTNASIANRLTITYVYQPIVQFQYGAQTIQFGDSVASSPPAYRVGDAVNVLYLESDPYDARIESFSSLWLIPMIFGGIGTIFLIVGAGWLFASRRGDASNLAAR